MLPLWDCRLETLSLHDNAGGKSERQCSPRHSHCDNDRSVPKGAVLSRLDIFEDNAAAI